MLNFNFDIAAVRLAICVLLMTIGYIFSIEELNLFWKFIFFNIGYLIYALYYGRYDRYLEENQILKIKLELLEKENENS